MRTLTKRPRTHTRRAVLPDLRCGIGGWVTITTDPAAYISKYLRTPRLVDSRITKAVVAVQDSAMHPTLASVTPTSSGRIVDLISQN